MDRFVWQLVCSWVMIYIFIGLAFLSSWYTKLSAGNKFPPFDGYFWRELGLDFHGLKVDCLSLLIVQLYLCWATLYKYLYIVLKNINFNILNVCIFQLKKWNTICNYIYIKYKVNEVSRSLRNLITPRGLGFCTLLRGFINLLGADKHNSLLSS